MQEQLDAERYCHLPEIIVKAYIQSSRSYVTIEADLLFLQSLRIATEFNTVEEYSRFIRDYSRVKGLYGHKERRHAPNYTEILLGELRETVGERAHVLRLLSKASDDKQIDPSRSWKPTEEILARRLSKFLYIELFKLSPVKSEIKWLLDLPEDWTPALARIRATEASSTNKLEKKR